MIIKIYVIFESFKSFENSRSQKELEIVIVNNNKINRFHLNDVNFFDSFYDNKTINIVFIIKHFDKSIYFRNIYIFIDRIKNVTRVKDNMLL